MQKNVTTEYVLGFLFNYVIIILVIASDKDRLDEVTKILSN
jgi:hypothetical protein